VTEKELLCPANYPTTSPFFIKTLVISPAVQITTTATNFMFRTALT